MADRVVLAYSGGLDTSVAIPYLAEKMGAEVIAVAVDVGQGGEDMEAKGNIVDHEFKIERDGDKIAEISKRWFRVRDTDRGRSRSGRRADHRLHGLHRPDGTARLEAA